MNQLFQFISNHLILCALFVAVVLALVIEEIRSKTNAAHALTAQELALLMNRESVAIIDIRAQEAFRKEHILSSTHMLTNIKSEEIQKKLHTKKQQHIVFIDNMGTDTANLAKQLIASGFPKVSILKGGFMAWKQAGLPVVSK